MPEAVKVLNEEIQAFEERLEEFEQYYKGKYVVIHGQDLVGAFDTLDAAAEEAVRLFGKGPYLIRRVGGPLATLPASVVMHPVQHADS